MMKIKLINIILLFAVTQKPFTIRDCTQDENELY
jgi:hypothetical protein